MSNTGVGCECVAGSATCIHAIFRCTNRSLRTESRSVHSALSQVVAGVSLVRWRIALARRFEREPIDALLRSLPREERSASATNTASLLASIARTERWIERARVIPNTCLYRSLARFAVLRERGLQPRFVMAMPASGSGSGHAWIELDDVAVLDDEDLSTMVVTFCYPPRDRTNAPTAQRSNS